MIIGAVKFPSTPDDTVEKVNELKVLLDAYFKEIGEKDASHLATEMLVMLWHSALIDFIEITDNGKRVGLVMLNLFRNPNTEKGIVTVSAFYILPEYRGRGLFTETLQYAKTIYQARQYDELEFVSKDVERTPNIGEKVGVIYNIRL